MTSVDGLVCRNRFTIAVIFPLVGAILLVASAFSLLDVTVAGLALSLNFNPYLILLGTLVMRLPLVAGLQPLLNRRLLFSLGALTAYAFGIEFMGVVTGWPYGTFHYGIDLGPMLFGMVPLALPIFFLPLVINSYLLVLLLFPVRSNSWWLRLPLVIGVVLLMDVVLDPAAVALGFWTYEGGVFYGVPLSNFAGWVLSATVGTVLLDRGVNVETVQTRLETCPYMLDDVVSFILLWGIINILYQNWFAALGAAALATIIVYAGDFDLPTR